MIPTSCPNHEELVALCDGELGEVRAGTVRAHANRCTRCRAELDQLIQLIADLRAPVPGALGGGIEAFADDLLVKLSSPRERRAPARARAIRWILLAAACAPLALGLGYRIVNRSDESAFVSRGAISSRADHPRRTLVRFGRIAGGVFEPLSDDDRLRADDVVCGEVGATEGAPRYLLAFLVDAAGERHWIYPAYELGAPAPNAMALPSTVSPRVLGTMVRMESPSPGTGRLVAIILPRVESVEYVEHASPNDLTRERLAAHYPDALVVVTRVAVEAP